MVLSLTAIALLLCGCAVSPEVALEVPADDSLKYPAHGPCNHGPLQEPNTRLAKSQQVRGWTQARTALRRILHDDEGRPDWIGENAWSALLKLSAVQRCELISELDGDLRYIVPNVVISEYVEGLGIVDLYLSISSSSRTTEYQFEWGIAEGAVIVVNFRHNASFGPSWRPRLLPPEEREPH